MRIPKKALAFAAILCGATTASLATDLKLLSTWDPNYTAVPYIAKAFMDDVKQRSGSKVNMTFMGPEVVPVFQQVQPVSAGVFDLLFTHGQLHAGESGIGSALDAITGDPEKRRSSGIWDWVDQHYQKKLNLKLIAIPTANTGYQLLLKQPMKDGMINGRKIRGTPGYHGLIKAVGGTPTVMAPGEIYNAAQSGIVDGTAWPAVGVIGMRWCEVMPTMVRPAFGNVSFMLLMNLKKFNSLPKDEQTALLEAGKDIEKKSIERFATALKEEDQKMLACGAKFDQQTPEWGKKANASYADGAWAIARQATPVDADALRALALKNGMTD